MSWNIKGVGKRLLQVGLALGRSFDFKSVFLGALHSARVGLHVEVVLPVKLQLTADLKKISLMKLFSRPVGHAVTHSGAVGLRFKSRAD